jgi:hypothetical protein
LPRQALSIHARPHKKEQPVVVLGIALGTTGLVLGVGVLFLLGVLLLVAGLMLHLLGTGPSHT